MNFVQNILWNSVEGFVEAGTRTAGGYAGDALLKAGDLIEGAGRSVGNGIERTASGYGNKLSSGAPPPPKNPGIKRSVSSPASSKAGSKAITRGPASKPPLGANKYPGGKQITGGAKSTIGGAQKAVGGSVGGAQKAIGSVTKTATKPLPKAYSNNTPYGTSAKPGAVPNKVLPKPYPGTSTLPNSTEKKTPVRAGGAPKPFNPAAAKPGGTGVGAKTGAADKPYPGTNTLPGQSNKTPVRAQKYKPMERMKAPMEKGKATFV